MNDALKRYLTGGKDTPTDIPSPPRPLGTRGKRKPNPVVVKIRGYSRFFEALTTLTPRLSPGSVAVWCWLWTCERDGTALTSSRRLAERFRVSRATASRWLGELVQAGLVEYARRGRTGTSPSVVRVKLPAPGPSRRRSASAPPAGH